ncbi:hypothetical protein RDABS01_027868, partial [Bienertia sinuspersici]
MAPKTSIVTLLLTLIILTLLSKSLEYPQQSIEETYFQDLYNMNIHFPVVLPPKSSSSSSFQSSDLKSPLVPAFFVLGDSSVDCGNNNFLGTFARADRLPYGRDFDTHQPTGRFCNGRIPVDFLALRLGLPFVPSYLGQVRNVEDMIHGVNYASAGAGIIFSSGSDLGQRVSLSQQIQQVSDTFEQFMMYMGEDAAVRLISDSIFYISVGTNDYIHYYLQNVSGVQSLYSPWSFNHFLAISLKQEIKKLHTANVRRVVVMGVAPMGCAPHYLWRHKSKNGECIQDINNMIMEFNFVMRYTIQELNQELSDAVIIFCDMYEVSSNRSSKRDIGRQCLVRIAF